MAVAAVRAGHYDAIRAHTEGCKTRGQRFKIVGVCAAVVLAGILALVGHTPVCAWVLVSLPVVATARFCLEVYDNRPHL